MTLKELIAREETSNPDIHIGDNVALEIWESNSSDVIYFEQNQIPSGPCDYADLVDAEVIKWEYITGFGYDDEVVDKLKIVIEVE